MGKRSRWGGGKHHGQWRNFHDTYDREVKDMYAAKPKRNRDKIIKRELEVLNGYIWHSGNY